MNPIHIQIIARLPQCKPLYSQILRGIAPLHNDSGHCTAGCKAGAKYHLSFFATQKTEDVQ